MVRILSTRKLYYENGFLSRFTAKVLDCQENPDGRFSVVLDQTAFYPLGGGQAADTGTLGAVRVTDTRERGDEVVHVCTRPLTPGETVEGQIDWEPRFIRMQQHTGEHILSGILFRRYGCHNSGFHMNLERMQVDFDCPIPQEALPELEWAVNEVVWKNLPVLTGVPEPSVLETLEYRTKRPLPWPVRIVEIPGVDRCACCGVHVAATGQAGPVKLHSMVPFREGVRIEMACGMAAMEYIRAVDNANREVSRLLSVPVTQTDSGVREHLARLDGEKLRAGAMERELFTRIAESFRDRGDTAVFREDLSPEGVRLLADKLSSACGGTAAVLSGKGDSWRWCLAAAGGDLTALDGALRAAFGARGGGKPNFKQGSLTGSFEDLSRFFRERGFRV